MTHIRPILSWQLAALVIWVFSPAAGAATELAKINGAVITLEDFNKKYQENLQYFQQGSPTKKGVLDDLIKRELGVQEARKLNLDKNPDVVDRMNTVLYHALLEKQLSNEIEAIHVSDDEAEGFYKKNPEIRTSHVFVAVPFGATKEVEQQAFAKIKGIRDEHLVRDRMPFSEVAQRFSEGAAAPMGGDLDYQTRDRLDPAYYAAAIKLKVGDTSEIIRSRFGYHIIKVTAVRPWHKTDKAQVKRLVFEERRKQVFDRYMDKLRGKADIKINSALIDK